MPRANLPYLNLPEYLRCQRSERYRATIIHGAPVQGKSSYARRLSEFTGSAYVDVLALVASSPQLSRSIDTLDAGLLRRLVIQSASESMESHPVPVEVVILDEFDFLIPVGGGALGGFLEMVRRLSVGDTSAVSVFFMQTHPDLERARLLASGGESRILRFEEIQALP